MREYDLYIVPTPIGNLQDITLRAIDILKFVDVIACEDIRVTQKLLNHYEIKTKCISYHKFNEKERIEKFLQILSEGKKIALVSDAGTPLFCDPGAVLVKELKKRGYSVTSLPGANAVITFLSGVAREGEDFVFVGFMPRNQSQIEKLLDKYRETDLVFYDSPNRIMNTLNIIKNNRAGVIVSIGRELTKVFEEIVTGPADEVIGHFHDGVVKGEIVGVVHREKLNVNEIELEKNIKLLKEKGFGAKDISVILSTLYGYSKNQVYKRIDCN